MKLVMYRQGCGYCGCDEARIDLVEIDGWNRGETIWVGTAHNSWDIETIGDLWRVVETELRETYQAMQEYWPEVAAIVDPQFQEEA